MTLSRSVPQRHSPGPRRAASLACAAAAAAAIAMGAGGPVTQAASVRAVQSRVDPCDVTGVPRVVAVGDVHGAFDAFVSILRSAGLIDERLAWAGGRAHLVQTGDIVDRGPEARKVLDLLMRLEQEASATGGQVHVLLGNHEVAVMLGDWRSSSPAEFEEFRTPESESLRERALSAALAEARQEAPGGTRPVDEARFREEFIARTPLGWLERRAAYSREGVYGRWLRERPAIAKVNGVVFVHGGLTPELATMGCAAINRRVRADLDKDLERTLAAPRESLVARPDGPLWYRGLAQMPDPAFTLQVDTILGRLNARAMVAGHSVVAGGRVAARFGGRVYLIDTGMLSSVYKGGRPSAIEFADRGVTAIYLDGRGKPVERSPSPDAG